MALSFKEMKITPKKCEMLAKLGLENSDDVLGYYPFRYECLEITPYEKWQVKDRVVFEARMISSVKTVRFGGRVMSKFDVENEENLFHITIFNRPWTNQFKLGQIVTIIGKYEGSCKVTALQMNSKSLKEQLGLTPVYPLKDGITQKDIQTVMKKVYLASQSHIVDFIPPSYMKKYRLVNRRVALRYIHFPQSHEELKQALRTLKYEEFLKFHISMLAAKAKNTEIVSGIQKNFDIDDIYRLANHLPYSLTNDQIKTINEILEDMQSNRIMYRLVQGDVGCGKTLVASLALYASALAGYQGALMAPTEILAKQHGESLKELFKNTEVKVATLYSSLPTANKKEILSALKNHEIDILVGTHSLIQENVDFAELGLVVADEQHRFGVEQRRKLKEKGKKVDFLLMSATPIPRTLATTLYGDLDISTILTMPKGRSAILTHLIKENSIVSILDDLLEILNRKEQIYIVCSAIEENPEFHVKNVTQVYESLCEVFNGKAKCGLLHGRMSGEEKEAIMHQFSKNEVQILVTTTVVEVGVNVVNATCMVIYDANRFGMSQLHQLRGRVGRGNKQGVCYLLTSSTDEESLKRLNVLEKTTDGFEISIQDLKLRGPGDFLGTRQSGLPSFVLGNLFEDTNIINTAKNDAKDILNDIMNPEYCEIRKYIHNNSDKINVMD